MNKYLIALVHLGCFLFTSCSPQSNKEKVQEQQQEVNVYTHRHYAPDQELFAQFEKELGIKVNVVNASADELMLKMENEGAQSPADVLITVDAGRLQRAKEKMLLQAVTSEVLTSNVPESFTRRRRALVWPDQTQPGHRLCKRSSHQRSIIHL